MRSIYYTFLFVVPAYFTTAQGIDPDPAKNTDPSQNTRPASSSRTNNDRPLRNESKRIERREINQIQTGKTEEPTDETKAKDPLRPTASPPVGEPLPTDSKNAIGNGNKGKAADTVRYLPKRPPPNKK